MQQSIARDNISLTPDPKICKTSRASTALQNSHAFGGSIHWRSLWSLEDDVSLQSSLLPAPRNSVDAHTP